MCAINFLWNLVMKANFAEMKTYVHVCCHFFGFSCPVEHWPTWAESPCGKHEGLNCKFISNSNTWAHYTTWAHSPSGVKLFKVCYKLCFCTWCCLLLFSCVQPISCLRWLQPVALFYLPHPPLPTSVLVRDRTASWPYRYPRTPSPLSLTTFIPFINVVPDIPVITVITYITVIAKYHLENLRQWD